MNTNERRFKDSREIESEKNRSEVHLRTRESFKLTQIAAQRTI